MRVLVVVAALTIIGSAAEAKASLPQQTSVSCSAQRDGAGFCRAGPPAPLRLAQGGAAGGGEGGGGSGDGSSGGTYGSGSSGRTSGGHGTPYQEHEKEAAVEDAMRACRQATAHQLDIQEADVTQLEGALDSSNPRLVRVRWTTVNQTRGDCSFEYGQVTFWGVTGSGG